MNNSDAAKKRWKEMDPKKKKARLDKARKARWSNMTEDERKAHAQKMSNARWKKHRNVKRQ